MKKIVAAAGIVVALIAGTVSTSAQGYYTQTQTRKAWSQRATGAVVGAGSGAVIGAIVNKADPAAGAAIGSVIGAGLGYLVGQHEDRTNPRPRYVQQQTVYDAWGRPVATRTRRTNNPGYNRGYHNRGYNRGYNAGYNNNGYYGNGCR